MKDIRGLFRNQIGLTLVEVIIAFTILTVVIFAFITLLTSSFTGIISAGEKSFLNFDAQQQMENRIADNDAYFTPNLTLEFSDTLQVAVPGGIVEVEVQDGKRKSTLTTFLPFTPTLVLNVNSLTVGYQSLTVDGIGNNTDFRDDTTLSIMRSDGIDIYVSPLSVSYSNDTVYDEITGNVSFTIPAGLPVEYSPYTITLTTSYDDKPTETVKAMLTVKRIRFIAVGNSGTVLVSPDGYSWETRDVSIYTDLQGVTWGNNSFVAVGDQTTLFLNDVYNYENNYVADNLNDVIWGGGIFIAVGNGGAAQSSINGKDWTPINTGTTKNLYAIDYSGSLFVAVGEDGTIIYSTNGTAWSESNNTGATLYDIVWDGEERFTAVGDSGTVLITTEADLNNWQIWSTGSTANLKGVSWGDLRFVTVGMSGVGLISNFDNTWSPASLTFNDLYGLTWGFNLFVAVGDNSIYTLLHGEDEWIEQEYDAVGSIYLNAAAARQ
ncbi:MAG: hypothetical protein KGZ63_03660 [Clostridiales bacterium]|jgi:photosystem II stability/assembly factor-like uncharacterized protein/competence protein ComGC|nr:hypothetical protein [Clostridiales bacterium]